MTKTDKAPDKTVPVTVLTGYLGAGKTTLLNRILSEPHGKKYAVIINEFGQTGVDNDLVVSVDEDIFEMNNGCICCTVRGDLIRIINGLVRRGLDKFDGIIVETTGLADPAPVAQTFYMDEDVRKRTHLDAVITVVDARHVLQRLEDSTEAEDQIAFADVLILNKIDLVNASEKQTVKDRLIAINPYARIVESTMSAVPLADVLDQGAFDLNRILALEPQFLEGMHTHSHDNGITSISLTSDRAVRLQDFQDWIGGVLANQGATILRAKGVLHVRNSPHRFVFQAVHMIADSGPGTLWKDGEKPTSKFVFIGRGLDRAALKAGFDACLETAG